MKVTRGAIPLYYQIAQILRSQIHSEEYKPGDLLPTEDQLIKSLRVSRSTVRQALQLLLNEGLIYRIAGKGTFVADALKVRHVDWSVGSLQGLIETGARTKIKTVGIKNVPATDLLAQVFRIPRGADVMQFSKIEFVGEEPFVYVTANVPFELAIAIPPERIEERAIFALLEDYCSLRIQEAHQWTSSALADRDLSHYLNLAQGDPVLLVERHFVESNGRTVQVSVDRYRTDKLRHYVRLTKTDSVRLSSSDIPTLSAVPSVTSSAPTLKEG